MRYTVAIIECDTVVPIAEVVSCPTIGRAQARQIEEYVVLDARADMALIRDTVTDAILTGHADDMININGVHEVCIAKKTPWLRITRSEAVQTTLEL